MFWLESDKTFVSEILAPLLNTYGLTIEFEEDESRWILYLKAKDFYLGVWGYQSYRDPDLRIWVHLESEVLQSLVEPRYRSVIGDGNPSLANVLRAYHSPWPTRLRWHLMYHNPFGTSVTTWCHFLRDLPQRQLDPLFRGELAPLVKDTIQAALLGVYDQVRERDEKLADKYDLRISYSASETWRIEFKNEKLGLVARTVCSNHFVGAQADLQLEGDHKRSRFLDELPGFASSSGDKKEFEKDRDTFEWTVSEVSRKPKSLIRLLDKYAGPVLSGEIPLFPPDDHLT